MTEEKKIVVEKEVSPKETSVEEEKVKEKKGVEKKNLKKDVAVARGVGLRISPKQCIYICRVIRGKNPDVAVARLQDVIDEKRVIPMAGLEVGHRKGMGLAGGRFPKNACRGVIDIVKQAAANAVVAEIDNPVIFIAKADRASAPLKKGGRKAKRCHLYIEIRAKTSRGGKR